MAQLGAGTWPELSHCRLQGVFPAQSPDIPVALSGAVGWASGVHPVLRDAWHWQHAPCFGKDQNGQRGMQIEHVSPSLFQLHCFAPWLVFA